jgi:alpha 1,6-mannosyltransferase
MDVNFTNLAEPKLVGDVLVLPVNAFGSGLPHSRSRPQEPDNDEMLIAHRFSGSWKESHVGK